MKEAIAALEAIDPLNTTPAPVSSLAASGLLEGRRVWGEYAELTWKEICFREAGDENDR